jgi:hypothetical protein
MSRSRPRIRPARTEDLPALLELNAAFETRAGSVTDRGRGVDPATLATLRRNRLGGDTPPVRLAEA